MAISQGVESDDIWYSMPLPPNERAVTSEEHIDAWRISLLALEGLREAVYAGRMTNINLTAEIVSKVPGGENFTLKLSWPPNGSVA